jgi:peptide/nickel transport system permease protein
MYLNYIIQRISMFFLVIFLAVSVNFIIPRLMPGDPVEQQISSLAATGGGYTGDITAMAEAYRAKFGLDQPLWRQYLNYLGDILRFDFGYSLAQYPTTVIQMISSALPWTLGLVGVSTLISFVIGTLLGGLLAWPGIPRALRSLIPMLMAVSSIPYFLLGIILIFFFAVLLKVLPAGGGYQFGTVLQFNLASMKDILRHAALPAASIIIAGIGTWALEMRGMMINILGEDFITLAEAKGHTRKRIFFWYGLRNALLPQLTALALRLGYVVSGVVLVEVIFSYPGIGYKLFQAVQTKDYFVIQGIVLLLIFFIGVSMFIMDLLYPIVDPRITYQKK